MATETAGQTAPDEPSTHADQMEFLMSETDAEAEADGGARPRAPLWIALVLSIVWLAGVAASVLLLYQTRGGAQPSLLELAILAAGATAPLSVIWLVAGFFVVRAQAPASRVQLHDAIAAERRLRRAAERVNESFSAFDGALAVAEQRADGLSSGIEQQIGRLMGAAERLSALADSAQTRLAASAAALGTSSEALDAASSRVAGSVEKASEQVSGLPAVLDPLAGRIEGLAEKLQTTGAATHDQAETLSRAVNQLLLRQRDLQANLRVTETAVTEFLPRIQSATEALGTQAETLDARGRAISEQLSASRDEVAASMDALSTRLNDLAEATRTMAGEQAEALEATLQSLRSRLSGAAAEAMNDLAHQTQHVSASINQLLSQFATQRQSAAEDVARLHEAWSEVESQIAAGLTAQEESVSGLQQRLRALGDDARTLPQALSDGMAATDQMQHALVETQREAARLTQALAATIEQASEARNTVAQAAEQSNTVAGGMQAVSSGAAALSNTLADVSATLDRQREELEALQNSMTKALADMTPALSAAREATQATAIQSSTQLVEALGRIRAMTAQASEALKSAADEIVQTAQSTLRRMSVESVRNDLVEPLRETMTEVETASRRGVEATRVAVGHLHSEVTRLNELASAIEKRVAETDAYLGQMSEQDLSRAAAHLIESLNSAAIDIAKMLGTDVSDTEWQAYLKGDRSIFVRRAVKLADRSERAQISRLFDSDMEFREQVRRYIRDFEKLIGRTMAERDGQALSVTLLSSDLGKLYVMLAQSINRLTG